MTSKRFKRQINISSSSEEDEPKFLIRKAADSNENVVHILKELKEEAVKTRNTIGRLTEELFLLKAEMKKLHKHEEDIDPALHFFLEPLKDEESLLDLEERLKQEDFFQGMIKYAVGLHGKNPQSFLRKCLKSILTDELAQKMTWIGTKEKKPAKNLIFIAAIRGAFQRKYKNEAVSMVDEVGKKFFHYAHDRITKRRK